MIHRLGLFVASLAAALALAVGLVAAGFAPGATPADPGGATPASSAGAQPTPRVQVDTVYVAPQAQPQDVTVTKAVGSAGHADDDEGREDD